MTKGCLDEAVLQAYLDGELSPTAANEAAAHLAACENCTQALGEAESELAFFSSAFAPDPSVNVPTVALRARLNVAIADAEEARAEARKTSGWNFGALVAGLGSLFAFAPRRAAVFASLLAVVAFALVFGISQLRPSRPASQMAQSADPVSTPPVGDPPQVAGADPTSTPPVGDPPMTAEKADPTATPPIGDPPRSASAGDGVQIANVSAVRPHIKRALPKRHDNAGRGNDDDRVAQPLPLPGEENYERVIASLEKVIEVGGEGLLKPSVRADYERNVAVVDRAIEETRAAARRNPKDKEALSFMLSAYQSKVELLSTVADRAQVAALGR